MVVLGGGGVFQKDHSRSSGTDLSSKSRGTEQSAFHRARSPLGSPADQNRRTLAL